MGAEPFVFVSYAHIDSSEVYLELARLKELGYRIWYDEGIDPGNEWPDEVARALKSCRTFLVFLSPRAIQSKNVQDEINFARNRDKHFIAVYLEETHLPEGLELRIARIQAIMKYRMTEERYQRQMEKSLPAALIGTTPPGQPNSTADLQLAQIPMQTSAMVVEAAVRPQSGADGSSSQAAKPAVADNSAPAAPKMATPPVGASRKQAVDKQTPRALIMLLGGIGSSLVCGFIGWYFVGMVITIVLSLLGLVPVQQYAEYQQKVRYFCGIGGAIVGIVIALKELFEGNK